MMRRFTLGLLLALAVSVPAQGERPPNFVVVMADDLGYGDVGCFGSERIATPHIDRMAEEGVRLTSFYTAGNVCTPSRAGIMTGRYAIRMGLARGVLSFRSTHGLPPEEVTLAEALRDRGYRTACIGKWHLGHLEEFWATEQGFDLFFGLPYSNDMSPLALRRGAEVIEDPVVQETLTERFVAEAVDFIETNRDEPFFLYVPLTAPHIPLAVSERFAGRSRGGLYGDVVETIDWGVGEILATLERLGLDEQTLVIFTSDNGPWYEGSAGPLRGLKGESWEGGHRVPFVARWPGRIPESVSSDAMTMNIDLFPTLVRLAGGEVPGDIVLDGRDIWPVIQGGDTSPHEVLYLFNNDAIAAVRTQRWKLVLQTWYRSVSIDLHTNYFYAPGMLFDMEADIGEQFNVVRENPDVMERMLEQRAAGVAELIEPHLPGEDDSTP